VSRTVTKRGTVSKTGLLKAVRAMCLHCCGGMRAEVRECHAKDCPLWPYRMGNPIPETRLPEAEFSTPNGRTGGA